MNKKLCHPPIYFLSFILFFSLTFNMSAQKGKMPFKAVLPNNLNWIIVQTEYFKLLNQLRVEQHLSVFTNDQILNLASFDQSHYMDSIHKVTHDQKTKKKETPQKRVFYYSGTHDQVGENCIMIFINKSMKTKYSKTPIIVKTEVDIAQALFLGWKNSPGHYQNMIAPGYDVAGLGFYFNKDSSQIYSAQVFGAKPFIPKKGLDSPENAYDVKESNPSVCNIMNSAAWKDLNNELTIMQGTDSIYLICKKLDKFKTFFSNASDGFYVDYVFRDQFPCEKNNLLHGSPIYDGYMMKPMVCKDIIARNQAPGNNLYASIGAVPKELKNVDFGLNYGIIKNGLACQYTYVTVIPDRNLDILNLVPKWIDNSELEIKQDTFKGVLTFNVPFERGKSTISEIQKTELIKRLDVYKPFVQSLNIKTFSSIEGNSEVNLKLQQERAQNLKTIITSVCHTELKTEIEAKENWEQFFKEIKDTKFNYLTLLSKDKIKASLQSKKLLDSLDIVLKATRIAKIEIEISAVVNNNSDPYILLGAYKKALDIGDSLNAFACQSKLIYHLRRYKLTNNDITTIEIPSNRKYIAHLTNWVGLATNDPEQFYTYKTREMAVIYSALDTNFLPLQFNYCIMALKYIREFGDTIIPINRLEYKMKKCYKLKTSLDSMYVDYMFLNFNILTAYNNYVIHRYDKIDKPLQDIKSYFLRHEITVTEGIKLGLLFNMYGKYNWTIEILYPLLKKYPENNDLLFLFIKTYTPSNSKFLKESEHLAYLALAKQRDKKRFKDWVDLDCFQLMRIPEVKAEYCKP